MTMTIHVSMTKLFNYIRIVENLAIVVPKDIYEGIDRIYESEFYKEYRLLTR
jgi:hypothetical protein